MDTDITEDPTQVSEESIEDQPDQGIVGEDTQPPGDDTDAVASDGGSEEIVLALGPGEWMLDSFDPMVEGVEAITHAGTPVPAKLETEVRGRARAAGVSIRKEG